MEHAQTHVHYQLLMSYTHTLCGSPPYAHTCCCQCVTRFCNGKKKQGKTCSRTWGLRLWKTKSSGQVLRAHPPCDTASRHTATVSKVESFCTCSCTHRYCNCVQYFIFIFALHANVIDVIVNHQTCMHMHVCMCPNRSSRSSSYSRSSTSVISYYVCQRGKQR